MEDPAAHIRVFTLRLMWITWTIVHICSVPTGSPVSPSTLHMSHTARPFEARPSSSAEQQRIRFSSTLLDQPHPFSIICRTCAHGGLKALMSGLRLGSLAVRHANTTVLSHVRIVQVAAESRLQYSQRFSLQAQAPRTEFEFGRCSLKSFNGLGLA
ncbi:hypothetical protein FIBSPDRAFT_60932 [Athelia psychrophila]|uniref:Secreted protein n=1 Tax=Athelia psychrophila TaxID=1759441 RepID=A0A166F5V2_9AGAM|nr:hypothetical protein FIBSPDRAFT_60932 [Fibularhizoctonia sp. CBS 109695]